MKINLNADCLHGIFINQQYLMDNSFRSYQDTSFTNLDGLRDVGCRLGRLSDLTAVGPVIVVAHVAVPAVVVVVAVSGLGDFLLFVVLLLFLLLESLAHPVVAGSGEPSGTELLAPKKH